MINTYTEGQVLLLSYGGYLNSLDDEAEYENRSKETNNRPSGNKDVPRGKPHKPFTAMTMEEYEAYCVEYKV